MGDASGAGDGDVEVESDDSAIRMTQLVRVGSRQEERTYHRRQMSEHLDRPRCGQTIGRETSEHSQTDLGLRYEQTIDG